MATFLLIGVVATGCAQAEPPAAAPEPGASGSSPTAEAPPAASASTSASSPSTAAATAEGAVLEVRVEARKVTPAPSQHDLAVGETLTVVVTADVDTTLHAHGFEVEVPVPAGRPTSVRLVGQTPGLYEIELHHPDLLLAQVAVR